MVDSYRHKGLRAQLVAELVKSGIKDEFVLRAIQAVPRHLFLDKAFEEWAYKDTAFPIDCEQTISQPYTVAFQTSLLHLKAREKVLEIGLGSDIKPVYYQKWELKYIPLKDTNIYTIKLRSV